MEKRTILLGDYDTAAHGLWTLTHWEFPEPEVEENLVTVPGRANGPLDVSTVLTDGRPRYGARPLTVTLESSEGDRMARDARIAEMVNKLHGKRVEIVLPDRPQHYAVGRLKVQTMYNDLAHASVQVTGTCEPWLYYKEEQVFQTTATTGSIPIITLPNRGAMDVVPLVQVPGGASVRIEYKTFSWVLSAGDYRLPDLLLVPGDNEIKCNGRSVISYREAVLK